MTRPCILIVVEDPGAVLYLRGLAEALNAAGMQAVTMAAGHATTALPHALPLPEALDDAAGLLTRHAPAALVVGTSENPDSPAFALIDAARRAGVPSLGAVDSAPNAEHRFRGRDPAPLAHAPDALLVADEATARAYVELGFADGGITVCGHPRFDEIARLGSNWDEAVRSRQRHSLFRDVDPARRVIVFVSELSVGLGDNPFRRTPDYNLHGTGSSDARSHIVLEELARAARALPDRPHLVLRLHPKQCPTEEAYAIGLVDQVSHREPGLDLVHAADLVCGMTSVLLVEAAALGRPVLSIIPQATERAWLGDAGQAIPSVSTRAALEEWLAGPWTPTRIERAVGSALDRMVAAISAMVRMGAGHAL